MHISISILRHRSPIQPNEPSLDLPDHTKKNINILGNTFCHASSPGLEPNRPLI